MLPVRSDRPLPFLRREVPGPCPDDEAASPMTTLNDEPVTPERLMSLELGISCGAVLAASQPGAAVATPNGRLVSAGRLTYRTSHARSPHRSGRMSSPTWLARAPPSSRIARATGRWTKSATVELDSPPSWADVGPCTAVRHRNEPPRKPRRSVVWGLLTLSVPTRQFPTLSDLARQTDAVTDSTRALR
jgi:hypothetical protein